MMSARALKLVAISSLLAHSACGGSSPTTAAPVVAEPAPMPAPPAAEEAPAEPPPDPGAASAPAADGARAPSGRPPLFFSNGAKIAEQVGETPAAKFELGGAGGATLRIPEYALRSGILVTFAIDKKAKRHKGAAGETYRLQAQVPPSAEFQQVESAGPKLELKLPKTGAASNLAHGEVKLDDKGKETVTWTVVAPAKVDDAAKSASFEITTFKDGILHLTTEAPGGA